MVRFPNGNGDEERKTDRDSRLRIRMFGLGPVTVTATGTHTDYRFSSQAGHCMKGAMGDPFAIPRQLGPDATEIRPDLRSIHRESVHTEIVSPSTRAARCSSTSRTCTRKRNLQRRDASDLAGVWQHVDMSSFEIVESKDLEPGALVGLYTSVGWSAYASDPDSLVRAIKQSSYVASATDSAANLVGLVRAISDDVSICYIQDLLVHPAHQRAGVGRALVDRVLKRYAHVRQTVLITDDEPGQRAFYESIDFIEAHDFEPASLRAFVQITNK